MINDDQVLVNREQDLPDIQLICDLLNDFGGL